MSTYYAVVRDSSGAYLEHFFGFGRKKGSSKKNHKYLMRVQEGDSYRYLYTPAEVAAYKAKSIANKTGLGKLHKANTALVNQAKYRVKRDVAAVKYGAPKVIEAVKKKKGIPSYKELINSLKPKSMADIRAAIDLAGKHSQYTTSKQSTKKSFKDYHNSTPLGRLDRKIWNTTIGRLTKKKI